MNKKQIQRTLDKMRKTAHCESCGNLNPKTDDGYTTCCNELVCTGPLVNGRPYNLSRFGTKTDFKRACCWAYADGMFLLEDRQAPDNSEMLL